MEFSIKDGDLSKQKTDCVVVGVFDSKKLSTAATALDKASKGAILAAVSSGDITGKCGSTLLLQAVPGISAKRVLLVGFGAEKEYGNKSFVSAMSAAFKALKKSAATDVTIPLNAKHASADIAWKVEQGVILAIEGAYRFNQMKSKADNKNIGKAVTFHLDGKANEKALHAAIKRGNAIGEGMNLTKDLGNMPPNIATPAYLASTAKELAKAYKFKCTILEKKDMEKLGMNTLLSVSKGSYLPPKFIVLEHNGGKKNAAPVVLVGKGITFDTGGISLKAALDMDQMKFDMCGAASVLGTFRAIAEIKAPINLVGLIPACENMPSGRATKPGDVVTSMSGQTIEILNTDAEGRLILADALTYAERYEPAAVVDIATLTGAMVIALGHVASGLFSNNETLARALLLAGDDAYDRAWQLPMWEDYQDGLASNFADFANIAGRPGGSITAACFLSRFTRKYDWAHLDIAGTAWKDGKEKGATGRPVPLLATWLLAQEAPPV